jgi:tetratricopeptide (TPR) repeat protein
MLESRFPGRFATSAAPATLAGGRGRAGRPRPTGPGKAAAMNHEGHYYAGVELFSAGEFAAAIVEYEKALALEPKFTDALHGLAQAHYARGDSDNAIAAAKRILAINPNDPLAYTTLALAYGKKGMNKEAQEASEKARGPKGTPPAG